MYSQRHERDSGQYALVSTADPPTERSGNGDNLSQALLSRT